VSGFVTVSFMRLTWVMDHLAYVPALGLIGLAVAGVEAVSGPGREGGGGGGRRPCGRGGCPGSWFPR
jgi:hypothetical protein